MRRRLAAGTVAAVVVWVLTSALVSPHGSAPTAPPAVASGTSVAVGAAAHVNPNPAVASAAPRLAVLRPAETLALTPPMGWNGYNHFHRDVTAATVEAAARALVSSGMAAAGYTYVNLDGGWDLPQRNGHGGLQPDPRKFPSGIKPVADYVHSLGLKFGIYTSAGTQNCAKTSAGSYGHYHKDAAAFASWGVDYVKLDWCYIPYRSFRGMTHAQVSQTLATQMAAALAATGRPIVYDVNDTTSDKTWGWARPQANLWRTSGDIRDTYAGMVHNFTRDVNHYTQAAPGHWNDPDMLEVGNGGMSMTEAMSQFSLWAELAAPLIAGNDLTTMSPAIRAILTNRAVIAVDQDTLGRQGYPVLSAGGLWVLTKPLANGQRAIVLFNQTNTAATISTSASRIGLGRAARYTLLNLWTGATTTTAGAITAVVPAHDVVMYRVAVQSALPLKA
jgi:alpha-galactosidase